MNRALTVACALALWVGVAAGQAPQGTPPAAPRAGAPPQGPGAPPGGGRGGGRAAITPRIVSFEASRTSLKPGESFDLTWATKQRLRHPGMGVIQVARW